MNRYLLVCRLRWPLALLLTGVIALLDQEDILSWGHAWPLYLILFGVLALAERAMYASQPPPPASYPYAAGYGPGYAPGYQPGYAPGYPPQPGAPPVGTVPGTGPIAGPGWTPGAPQAPGAPSTSIVPVQTGLEARSIEGEREARKSWEEEGR